MKPHSLTALLIVCASPAFAAGPAVQQWNVDGGANFEAISSSGSENDTAGLVGNVTFPIAGLFGGSIGATASRTNIQLPRSVVESTDSSSAKTDICGYNSREVIGKLFMRDPEIGRVGVGYDSGHVHSRCDQGTAFIGSDQSTLTTHTYLGNAELYLKRWTVAADYTRNRLRDGNTLSSEMLTVSWYPMEEIRISPKGGRFDGAASYGLGLEVQPEFLGDSLSVSVGYSLERRSQDVRTFSIGLVYHFGTTVDLLTRDRQYR